MEAYRVKYLPMLMLAGCCVSVPSQTVERTYYNVTAIEYREDGSVVITFETGRVTVIKDGRELEDF